MVSRREFVVGGAAVAATAGMAGCSRLPFMGTAGYAAWTPVPEDGRVDVFAVRPAEMAGVNDLEGVHEEYQWEVDPPDVDFHLGSLSEWTVTEGDLSMTDVEDALEGDLKSAGTHAGYDRYSGGGRANLEVAFHEGTVVTGSSADVVERVVDAGEGDGDRVADENDDVDTVRNIIDDGDAVILGATLDPGEEVEQVAMGGAFEFAEGQSDMVYAIVFRTEDLVDEEEIRSDLEDDDSFSDISVSRDGRVVEVTGSFETSDF